MAELDAGFRVATFNLESLSGGLVDDLDVGASLEERCALLRPQLQRLRADVLCLQEVDGQRSPPGQGKRRSLSALDELLQGTGYEDFHRVASFSRSKGGARDRHNVVILSRLPVLSSQQIFHDLVPPPMVEPVTALPKPEGAVKVEWDRPFVHARLAAPVGGRDLHVINVHLRAPRAAFVEGHRLAPGAWSDMAAWAEGFYLAAIKRAGQAFEVRLLIEQILDQDPDAWIVVAGDFNADLFETPVRCIRGDEEDAGNAHLAGRTLVSLERGLPDSVRFSVVHHGRARLPDHILVSRPLMGWFRQVEIHNEALGDELVTAQAVPGGPSSYHAPLVADFAQPD